MLLRNIPIRRKLMTALLLTSGVVLVLTCVSFFIYEYHSFRQSTVLQFSTLAKVIATNSTAALAFDSPEDAKEILSALGAEGHVISAALYDQEGRLFSQYPDSMAIDTFRVVPKSEGHYFRPSFLESFQPVVQGTMRLGTLYIKSDLKAMEELTKLFSLIVFGVVAICSLLAYLLSKVLQRSISGPILALTGTARAVSDRKDYTVRATKQGNDEIGLLTDAFNHMLMRIQEQNTALSDFNKNLEQKVFERTAELEIAYKEQKEAEREIYDKNQELVQALEELQSTEEQLIELNNELERRVQKRTNELLASEEELKAKNTELEKTNVDLDNFIYTASHDLKSPISNIEGLTIVLSKKLNDRLDENEKKLMDMIGQSVAKFKNTIADLTEITKVQKNLEYPEENISFKEVLEDVKTDIKDIISESGVLIEEDIKAKSIVYARHNLRSIIYNLLSNAIKYRSPERSLKIHIRTYEEAGRPVLSLEDNGLGINEKDLPKLFTMFKRLHAHVEGTGIGLYIIKRVIENKGGRIEVESKLDEGTRFRVYF